jgi:hypothetical protein
MQFIVIHSADSAEAESWKPTTTAVHQRAANRTERTSHCVASADGLAGRVRRQLVFAADVN